MHPKANIYQIQINRKMSVIQIIFLITILCFSFQNLRRWESSTSLASDGTGFRRRSQSASSGRGGSYRGRGTGNSFRGGQFRRGADREDISKDALDKELDEYMTGTQNVIDLDAEA